MALEQRRSITLKLLSQLAGRKPPRYDRAGDGHYQLISAFIKSMRASDPDASAYWLQRMLEAGEDPLFLLRRMLIFASEDIGLADPRALQHTIAGLHAFQAVGLPEGHYLLMQSACYLACAAKSRGIPETLKAAQAAVRNFGDLQVPPQLRPKGSGGDEGSQPGLPGELRGYEIFQPGDFGEEMGLRAWLKHRRRST